MMTTMMGQRGDVDSENGKVRMEKNSATGMKSQPPIDQRLTTNRDHLAEKKQQTVRKYRMRTKMS